MKLSYLKGEVKQLLPKSQAIVLPQGENGIGYSVNLPLNLSVLESQEVELFIHTQVTQDDLQHWGFTAVEHLQLFQLLVSVSGVGARTAHSLVSAFGAENIVQAIQSEDHAALRIPGVGEKTAKKIILELRSRMDDLYFSSSAATQQTYATNSVSRSDPLLEEVYEALETLGYKDKEAQKLLQQVDTAQFSSSEELLKAVLSQR